MPKPLRAALLTSFVDIALQWHPSKNGNLTPDKIVAGSNKRYWWQCPAGQDHEWQASVASRTNSKGYCPFCTGRKFSVTNSLATLYPEVAAQWHTVNNGNVTPDQILAGSGKKYWWRCPRGSDHQWEAMIITRARKGTGCPYCSGLKVSETNSLANLFPEIASEWHKIKNGVLTPEHVIAGSGKKHWWQCSKNPNHEWEARTYQRTKTGTGCPYCVGRNASETNSLASLYPEVAAQWHPIYNGNVMPSQVLAGSKKKYWWQCPEASDHQWEGAVVTQTHRRIGCPYCEGLKASEANSLAALYPEVAAQWHPVKNGNATPNQVLARSGKKYWWQCSKGLDHQWEGAVVTRTLGGFRCPYCRGLKASATNSLAALYPKVAAQWHKTKNGVLNPKDVVAGSGKKHWWQCSKNTTHEWEARTYQRTKTGSGCPYCVGRKASETNCLAALHPEVASEWHPTKNGDMSPDEVVVGSNQQYWWQCSNGPDHEWQARVASRTNLKTSCPCCAGRKISVSNSLATLYPEVASQWHSINNGYVTPNQVLAGSKKKYWWQCPKGSDHQWEGLVVARTHRRIGCPYCRGLKASATNSLASLYPEVAAQWHKTKNGALEPSDVVAGSGKKYWWQCSKHSSHTWSTTPNLRTKAGTGCPFCSGNRHDTQLR